MEELEEMEGNTIEQNYDLVLIENLRRVMETQAEEGTPQSYAIYVDGLKVVSRTLSIEKFVRYKSYPVVEFLQVTLYKGASTPSCVHHIFRKNFNAKENLGSVKNEIPAGYLSGVEVQKMIDETINKERLNNKIASLEKELAEKERNISDRDKQIKEADDYISKLQTGIESLKNQIDDKKSAIYQHLIDLVKNPPSWAQMMWLGKTTKNAPKQLTGTENKEDDNDEVVDLRNKNSALTEDEKRHLSVIRRMEEELEDDELHLLMLVNDKLIEDPKQIPIVADCIDIKPLEKE